MSIYKVLWTLKYQFKILISDQYFLCPNKSNKTCKSKKEIYSKVFSRGNFFENNFYKIQVIKIVFTSICVRNWKQTFSREHFTLFAWKRPFIYLKKTRISNRNLHDTVFTVHLHNVSNFLFSCVYLNNRQISNSHSAGSPIVKIFMTRQVSYTVRTVLSVRFQGCVTLNSFMGLILTYEPKCDF